MTVVALSLVAGILGSALAAQPRLRTVTIAVAILAATLAVTRPAVQNAIMAEMRDSAMQHQGHAYTPGLHYKLLDWRYYEGRFVGIMDALTPVEAGRFVLRAVAAAILVPLPWQAESRFLHAYLPEQMVWYALILLLPWGIVTAWRCHPDSALVLTVYIMLTGTAVALRSGNFGTLIRHRGLILPFVICLACVAICQLMTRRLRAGHPPVVADAVERTV
jgi:hypothetical protein